jgi:hypothetical protein
MTKKRSAPNKTAAKIRASRPDISDFLFHFTKNSNGLTTLEKIIEDRKLLDFSGKHRICFSEAPLLLLDGMFKIFDAYPDPMYSRYGIAINKQYMYKMGARPVFYSTAEDYDKLPDELKWIFEELTEESDFSWLREWRLPNNSFDLDPDHCFIVTNTTDELKALAGDWNSEEDIQYWGENEDGRIVGEAFAIVKRDFKGVSFEQIRELNSISGDALQDALNNQHIGEEIGFWSLGGFAHPPLKPISLSRAALENIKRMIGSSFDRSA